MEHSHGSTAIAGTTRYTGLNFPDEFRGNMFVGNVMTSRVNRDSIRERGASLQAIEEPDFVVSDDPWFRPVDMQVAPDGSLYIADFYNKIIGHVEVPLDHPQRDKLRGRIWRVVYGGDPGNPAPLDPSPNLRLADAKALIAAFDHPNLGVRMRAGDELCDRLGADAVVPLRDALPRLAPTARAHALWALHRLGAGRPEEVRNAATSGDRLLRVHVMRILAETATWDGSDRSAVLHALDDASPIVRRAAVDALGRHPRADDLDVLLRLSGTTPETDVHLRHAVKLTLLEIIRVPGTLARWAAGKPSKPAADLMAGVALALPSQEAGAFLIDYLGRYPSSPERTGQYLAHAAKNLSPAADVSTLAKVAQREDDLDLQLDLLMAVRNGLRQRRKTEPDDLRKWGGSLASRLLTSVGTGASDWIAGADGTAPGRPWRLEPRGSVDRPGKSPFLSSLPLGETYTGTLRSREFVLPPSLSLSVCGHLGFLDKPVEPKNMVRVRLVGSGEVVAEALAPRDDTARRVTWTFDAHAGKAAVIEVVDGLPLSAFAWIAVARIEPPVLAVPTVEPEVIARRQKAAAELAATLGLHDLEAPLKAVASERLADPAARAAAAKAIVSFHPDFARTALLQVVADPSVDPALASEILADATRIDGPSPGDLLVRVMRSIPSRLQAVLAGSLAETRDGGERLLKLAEQGAAPSSLLQQPILRDKLLTTKPEGAESRLATLTASLPPMEVATQRLIHAWSAAFDRAKASPARGKEVFARHCAACHQINGQGGLVGPQLDGVGNRGHERIVEDVLDPSRNVDPAFYSTLLALNDGRTLSGFVRRREGINIVLVDSTGKEQSIPAADVEQERPTKLSPMPANFGVALAESELNDLLAFLIAGSREAPAPVSWRVVPIERRFRSEGSAIADVNRDGKPDILVGELWYEAPSWTAHEITKPGDYGDGAHSYSGCFYCYADDVNRDGWPDAIVIGIPGEPCHWLRESQGQIGPLGQARDLAERLQRDAAVRRPLRRQAARPRDGLAARWAAGAGPDGLVRPRTGPHPALGNARGQRTERSRPRSARHAALLPRPRRGRHQPRRPARRHLHRRLVAAAGRGPIGQDAVVIPPGPPRRSRRAYACGRPRRRRAQRRRQQFGPRLRDLAAPPAPRGRRQGRLRTARPLPSPHVADARPASRGHRRRRPGRLHHGQAILGPRPDGRPRLRRARRPLLVASGPPPRRPDHPHPLPDPQRFRCRPPLRHRRRQWGQGPRHRRLQQEGRLPVRADPPSDAPRLVKEAEEQTESR